MDAALAVQKEAVRRRAQSRMQEGSSDEAFDVVAEACHDMRTPLAAMRATVELLTDPSVASVENDGAVVRHAERLTRALTWLEALTDNLMFWALQREGTLQLRRSRVPLSQCVQGAVAIVEPLLRQRGQSVRVSQPAEGADVLADADRVIQVLINLLMNASTYGPPGHAIDLVVRALGHELEVRVTDSGPGIEPHEQARVFDRYVQGTSGERKRGGLGLGLHIVKQLVALHDGSAGVDSRPGEGASFWIRIPSLVASDGVAAQTAQAAHAA
jgi:signal transduction histidine kinase